MTNIMLHPSRLTRDVEKMLSRSFDDFFSVPGFRADTVPDYFPKVDIKETKENLQLTFEVPGMSKEDIKVLIKDKILTVSGKREDRREEKSDQKGVNWIRTEISVGEFSRSFTLPDYVNPDRVRADYKHGMLEVTLDKREELKPKEIEVKIG